MSTTESTSLIRPQRSLLPANRQYTYYFDDWLLMFDTLMGQREVKDQDTTYLPKTRGMTLNPNGSEHYEAYKLRAVFPEYTSETALGMYGLFWQKIPQINISNKGDEWMKNATIDGKSFIQAYRDMVYQQITIGRYGMLVDVPKTQDKTKEIYPQIVPYMAGSIVNWGEILYKGKQIVNFILLDESRYEVNYSTLTYEIKNSWRLCGLHTHDEKGNPLKEPMYYTVSGEGSVEEIKDTINFKYPYGSKDITYPSYKGKTLDYIPFVFVNVTNLDTDIEKPPLLKIANNCLASYRTSADLFEAAFKTTQATLFGSGVSASTDIAVGSNAAVTVEDRDAKLQYVEISGSGLTILKDLVAGLNKDAKEMGIQLTQKSSGDETGASVEKHITVQTSTLKSISTTAAQAMKNILNIINDWTSGVINSVGIFGNNVNIIPSQEFSSVNENSDAFFKIWSAYKEGALSHKDYYEWQKINDFTSYEEFEEWKKNLDERIDEINKVKKLEEDLKNKKVFNQNKGDNEEID